MIEQWKMVIPVQFYVVAFIKIIIYWPVVVMEGYQFGILNRAHYIKHFKLVMMKLGLLWLIRLIKLLQQVLKSIIYIYNICYKLKINYY
jgi:hypothetical protein